MDTETIEEEIQINGSRKIVLGVRVFPELKNKLGHEAALLKISLSEHAENILLNKEDLAGENSKSLKEAESFKRQTNELTKLLSIERANHKTESDSLKNIVAELQSYISVIKVQAAIHQDKRLLHLFARVKGKKDTIVTPENGTIFITYETTTDVLTALIYSNKIKP